MTTKIALITGGSRASTTGLKAGVIYEENTRGEFYEKSLG